MSEQKKPEQRPDVQTAVPPEKKPKDDAADQLSIEELAKVSGGRTRSKTFGRT